MASQGPPGRQGGPEAQFRPAFNQEELRVLRECNRESFYFRSVPFAAAFSAAAFLAMRRGMLRPSERFGYTPKMLGGVAIGYFIGKLSYQNKCAEKLMCLADSPIGEALRKRKNRPGGGGGGGGGGGSGGGAWGYEEMVSAEPGFSVGQPGVVRSAEGASEDPRTDLDMSDGLDEYHRVTQSLSPYTDTSSSSSSSSSLPPTTYQELRRQNREDYVNRMAEKYRRIPSDHQADTPPPPPPPPPSSSSSSSSSLIKKNKYGDDVYE